MVFYLYCMALNWTLAQKGIFLYIYRVQNVACMLKYMVLGWRGTVWLLIWELYLMPLTPEFRELVLSLHKPFIHLFIPWEELGKYRWFAVDNSLKCDLVCSTPSSQSSQQWSRERRHLRGQAECSELGSEMGQTGRTSDENCLHVHSSSSNSDSSSLKSLGALPETFIEF